MHNNQNNGSGSVRQWHQSWSFPRVLKFGLNLNNYFKIGKMVEDEELEEPTEKYDHLTEEDVEQVWDTFDNFDKLKDQTIEIGQLGPFLRWMNLNPTDKELKAYAREFDPTHKGIITRSNCTKIIDRTKLAPDTYEELIGALKVFDKKGTGKIDVPELRYIMTKMGDGLDEDVIDDMIWELDPTEQGFITINQYANECYGRKSAGAGGDADCNLPAQKKKKKKK